MWLKPCAAITVLACLGAARAHAQAVQFKDLEGATIEAEFVYQRTFRIEGRASEGSVRSQGPARTNELHSQFNIAIGPGDAIEQAVTGTVITPTGRERATQPSKTAFVLNKPRRGRNGPVVWKFENGTLTRLQSLLSGARRISFILKRNGDTLTCTVDAAFAREDGIGEIETRSTSKPGAKVQWLDIKQKSAACRVVRR